MAHGMFGRKRIRWFIWDLIVWSWCDVCFVCAHFVVITLLVVIMWIESMFSVLSCLFVNWKFILTLMVKKKYTFLLKILHFKIWYGLLCENHSINIKFCDTLFSFRIKPYQALFSFTHHILFVSILSGFACYFFTYVFNFFF